MVIDAENSEVSGDTGPTAGQLKIPDNQTVMLLGKLAVRLNIITVEQLESGLKSYKKSMSSGEKVLLGDVLIAQNVLKPSQFNFLIKLQQMKKIRHLDRKFGDIAVENGFVTEAQIEEALQSQKVLFMKEKKRALLGDILVASGVLSAEQKNHILSIQQRLSQLSITDEDESEDEIESVETTPHIDTEGEIPFQITVSEDRLTATIQAIGPFEASTSYTLIRNLLEEHKITYGLKTDAEILEYLKDPEKQAEPWVIAEGKPPVPSRDGEIKYHFDIDPLKVGTLTEEGKIDFKDRGKIPQVTEGELLAEVIPPDPGAPGTDVHAREIPVALPDKAELHCGKGVSLSEDRKRATATIKGSPSLTENGAIFVFPAYIVDGDIGYKTGHVDFEGDIQVSGRVEDEFNVKGGRLTTQEIGDAQVDIEGDVVVLGGIIGARIKAGGSLKAWYIHKSQIEVSGDIIVQQEIMDSDIKAGGALMAQQCIILSSRISATQGIIADTVGSDTASPSTLIFGIHEQIDAELAEKSAALVEKQNEKKALQEQLEADQSRYAELNTQISEMAQVQDRAQINLRQLTEKREQLVASGKPVETDRIDATLQELEQRAEKAEEDLSELFTEQDRLNGEIQQLTERGTAIEQEIEFIQREIDALIKRKEQETKDASVAIWEAATPLTKIQSSHTALTLQNAMKSLSFKERRVRTKEGGIKWKMVTESL